MLLKFDLALVATAEVGPCPPAGWVPQSGRTGPKCPAVEARGTWSEHKQDTCSTTAPKGISELRKRSWPLSHGLSMRFCILPGCVSPRRRHPGKQGLPRCRSSACRERISCFSASRVSQATMHQHGATGLSRVLGQGCWRDCVSGTSPLLLVLVCPVNCHCCKGKCELFIRGKKLPIGGMAWEVNVNNHLHCTCFGK